MMKILIIAEHQQQQLKLATHHTVTAAKQLGDDIDVMIMGTQCQAVAAEACRLEHVRKVLVADNEVYAHQLAENTATLVAEVGKEYDYILAGATTFGKNLLPRVAALLDTSMISDVTKVISKDTFVRPIYAGNVMATVQSQEKQHVLSIRTTAFPAVKTLEQANCQPTALS